MLQFNYSESVVPLSTNYLTELYKNLTFPQRAKIFEIFLPEDARIPKTNTPYSSSMIPEAAKKIITIFSDILRYYSDQWVDEAIIGFLSIFSIDEKPIIFNYNQYIADAMHDHLDKFPTEVSFKYYAIFVYLFIYNQANMFPFTLQRMNEQGDVQSVIHWTSLVRRNSTEFSFRAYVDQFPYTLFFLLNIELEP